MVQKKCKPQKIPNKFASRPSYYECANFIKPEKLFEDNVKDIAKSLNVIMIICGIHECKADNTIELIRNIFKYYNDARLRPNCAEPPNKLCKRSVLCCLARKCLMTLVEAQLTYYIIKYALKAYFSHIPVNCVDNPIMDLQIISEQETAWKRAAKRTIQVYAECEGIMHPLIGNYKNEINGIYQGLLRRMKQRAEPIELPQCRNADMSNESLAVQKNSTQQKSKAEDTTVTSTVREEYPFAKFRKCCKCNFPLDLCDCKVNPKSGKLCMDCSQGPYFCEWFRMDKEHRIKAKDHICPIDCEEYDSSLDDGDEDGECQCDLEQLSDCETESSCSDEETTDIEGPEVDCLHVEESESESEEVEARMDGCCYCCHMPICDMTVNMEKSKPPPKRKQDPIFLETQVVPPAKNIKNVTLPPEVPKKPKISRPRTSHVVKTDKDKQIEKPVVVKDHDEDDPAKDELTEKPKIEKDLKWKDDTTKVQKDTTGVRDSDYAPVVKPGDNMGPPSGRRVTGKTENDTRGNRGSKGGDSNDSNDDSKNRGSDNKNGRVVKTRKSTGRKLPCCKCGTKKEVKKIKKCRCVHKCRPATIPKNRLVPAPILC